MRERINELAEQAGFTVARGPGLKDTVPKDVFIANACVSNEVKKFSELIVRECASLCEERAWGMIEKGIPGHEAVEGCSDIIKQHFGVTG